MILIKKFIYIYFFVQIIIELSSADYNHDFILNHFHDYFSAKLKFINIPNKNEYKIVCSEKIYQNDLIFSIPFEKIIKPSNSFVYQSEITQIIKSFNVDENLGDTVTMIIYALLKKFFEKLSSNDENQKFINEYLMNINSERDTILWWDQKDLEFVKKSIYYFNEVWVENMIKETDSAISLTKEIFQDFQKKNVKKYIFCKYQIKIES